jgi:hypothetical protein
MPDTRTFITVPQASAAWGKSPATVRAWCARGRIAGAWLAGPRMWLIPADHPMPVVAQGFRAHKQKETK